MNADVIVAGAGIVGAACAHELARSGLSALALAAVEPVLRPGVAGALKVGGSSCGVQRFLATA